MHTSIFRVNCTLASANRLLPFYILQYLKYHRNFPRARHFHFHKFYNMRIRYSQHNLNKSPTFHFLSCNIQSGTYLAFDRHAYRRARTDRWSSRKCKSEIPREACIAKAAWKFSNDRPKARTGDKDRRLEAHKVMTHPISRFVAPYAKGRSHILRFDVESRYKPARTRARTKDKDRPPRLSLAISSQLRIGYRLLIGNAKSTWR